MRTGKKRIRQEQQLANLTKGVANMSHDFTKSLFVRLSKRRE
jgi:hypothetical protein